MTDLDLAVGGEWGVARLALDDALLLLHVAADQRHEVRAEVPPQEGARSRDRQDAGEHVGAELRLHHLADRDSRPIGTQPRHDDDDNDADDAPN